MAIITNSNINNNFIIGKTEHNKVNTTNNNTIQGSQSFQEILQQRNSENVTFSKHAVMRLNDRNISLSNSQMERVESGVQIALKKGINDSLVLVDNIALLVNVKNKTVVTAMESNNSQENVYTNIDGAVIV